MAEVPSRSHHNSILVFSLLLPSHRMEGNTAKKSTCSFPMSTALSQKSLLEIRKRIFLTFALLLAAKCNSPLRGEHRTSSYSQLGERRKEEEESE